MDEDITIINEKTRNEKIKNFLIENKKILISVFLFFVIIFIGFYSYQIYNDSNREQLSDKYNNTVIEYNKGEKLKVISKMIEIVEDQDTTYSPLALYFLIDNNLIGNKGKVNDLFDILINKTSLKKEIKNLIIYKKALFNADSFDENQLLDVLSPLLNTENVWKSHALYLLAEYFYSKNEKQKSKEFFNKIINLDNYNKDIKIKAQKRLTRDLSD